MIPRDEGSGGPDGIVLPLDMVGTGLYDVAYTVPIRIGDSNQNLSLQVDTGSSDLWVVSTACSSSLCGQTNGRRYDSSNATLTGIPFSIDYLQGSVDGPIVWDTVEVGGYSIENQALAAAEDVVNEPLSPNYDGILGLALPINSIIAASIPPVTSNSADGAAWASNLFSITPISSAPAARFLSLSLARPGSDRVPSMLGIGRHPSQLVSDPSKVTYGALASDNGGTGSLFWKAGVRAITVYVDGQVKPVNIGRSNTGAAFPSAVLDSGVPLILTTSFVANGIYGAIGISPASDGQYYVPCNTPLNMSITLDDRPEISLHPLDLTAEPPKENNAQFCVGLIQAADAQLATPNSPIGDMILGVPFMRNTYTVMAYTPPDENGSFVLKESETLLSQAIRPQLGLMGLTDPTTALHEFQTVRVLNQPLAPSNSSGSAGAREAPDSGGKKLSVGIIVLIGLLGFFALCAGLFFLRWFLLKRKWREGDGRNALYDAGGEKGLGEYQLARRGSRSIDEADKLASEDALRALRFEAFMKKEMSQHTTSTTRTHVEELDVDTELGFKKKPDEAGIEGEMRIASWDPIAPLDWGDDTLVGTSYKAKDLVDDQDQDGGDGDSSPERPFHQRTLSETAARHTRTSSDSPLLPPEQSEAESPTAAELGFQDSMAGIRTSRTAVSIMNVGSALPHSGIDNESRYPTISSLTRARPERTPTGPRMPSTGSLHIQHFPEHYLDS